MCFIPENIITSVVMACVTLLILGIYSIFLNFETISMFEFIDNYNSHLLNYINEHTHVSLTVIDHIYMTPEQTYEFGWVAFALCGAVIICLPTVVGCTYMRDLYLENKILCYFLLMSCLTVIGFWFGYYSNAKLVLNFLDIPSDYLDYLSAQGIEYDSQIVYYMPLIMLCVAIPFWIYLLIVGTLIFDKNYMCGLCCRTFESSYPVYNDCFMSGIICKSCGDKRREKRNVKKHNVVPKKRVNKQNDSSIQYVVAVSVGKNGQEKREMITISPDNV